MPLVLLRAFAYLTDLLLIVSNQQHVISVSTFRINTPRLSVSRAAELRCRGTYTLYMCVYVLGYARMCL